MDHAADGAGLPSSRARSTDGPIAGGPAAGGPGPATARGRLPDWLATHGLFLLLLALAAALRVTATLGYRWQLWFNDSDSYLYAARHLTPTVFRPQGYGLFLRLLHPLHSLGVVIALQHAAGLAIAVLCYVVCRRHRVRGWVAALLTIPALFDAFQIQLEHLIMSDALFEVLLAGAVTLLMWRRRARWWVAACSGALIGAAGLVRAVGLPMLVVFGVYLLIRRAGWRPLCALLLAGLAPLAGYMIWFNHVQGGYGFSRANGVFLYSRTMEFADCAKMHPEAQLRALCDPTPPAQRKSSQFYIWDASSPLRRLPGPIDSKANNQLAGRFAKLAIRSQPLDYLRVVAGDVAHSFRWHREVWPDAATYRQYLFRQTAPVPTGATLGNARWYDRDDGAVTHIVNPYAQFLGTYQRYVFLPGTLLGVLLLAGLAGLAARWRRFGGPALLPWALAVALLVIPDLTSDFSYRYLLPVAPFACLAVALVLRRRDSDPAGL